MLVGSDHRRSVAGWVLAASPKKVPLTFEASSLDFQGQQTVGLVVALVVVQTLQDLPYRLK
jgi:hypothetical protein